MDIIASNFRGVDFNQHQLLPEGSYSPEGPLPQGYVLNDILEVMLRIFSNDYFKGKGLNADGEPDPTISEASKQLSKTRMR